MKQAISTLTGDSFLRSNVIEIRNPHNAVPSVLFKRERISELSDGTLTNVVFPDLVEPVTDLNEVFDLKNPVDDTVIGTMTYGQLYAAIYSVWLHVEAKNTPVV